jgi:ABC-type bacteriocin/lantibiotic exporter with double-glycine peptidase domain
MNHLPISSRPWFILVICLLIGAIIVFLLQSYQEPFEDVNPAISTLINDDTLSSLIKMIQQNPERVHQMVKELSSTISTMDPKTISSMNVEPLMKLFQNLTPPS